MATRYLVATGAWTYDNTSIWSASSGGASGASAPGAGDDVIMNAASGSSVATLAGWLGSPPTVVKCKSLNCTGFTGTFTDGGSNQELQMYGDLTLSAGMTFNLDASFLYIMRPCNFTSAGHAVGAFFAGSAKLLDDLVSNNIVYVGDPEGLGLSKIFDANDFNVTAEGYYTAFFTGELYMRSGTFEMTGARGGVNPLAGIWATLAIEHPGTSTIKVTDTSSNAKVLQLNAAYDIWLAGGGEGVFAIDYFSIDIHNLKVDPPTGSWDVKVAFLQASTFTIDSVDINSSGGNYIQLFPTNGSNPYNPSTTAFTLSSANDITVQGAKIRYNIATGGGTFIAQNSVDQGHNSGWVFNPDPAANGALLGADSFLIT